MNYYLICAFVLFIYFNVWFVISLIKKRNDVADIAWGIGFVFLAWFSYFFAKTFNIISVIALILVSIWGIRLALHIYSRNKVKKEDYRYLAWRKEWGKLFYIRSYFQVFILQGVLLFLIVLPVLIINNSEVASINYFVIVGILIWIIGFFFESVGDAQLSKFIKNPSNKGKVLDTGLWSYTRHPNYFGEVSQWWGIWLISLGAFYGLLGIISPITITFLILKVSGIPMLEKKMREKPEYDEYIKNTSVFFPLPPKRSK